MNAAIASRTQRDQVQLGIATGLGDGIVCGGVRDLTSRRKLGISSRLCAGFVAVDTRILWWQGTMELASVDGESRRGFLPSMVEERPFVLARQKPEKPYDWVRQDIRVAIVQVRTRQEICAIHLQTVLPRLVRP